MPADVKILVFARFPIPGQVKTRLIPALDPAVAAQLHRRMTEHTLDSARRAQKTHVAEEISITVCYTGAQYKHFRAWLGADLHYAPQVSGDIGVRMQSAIESALLSKARSVLAIGSDIPGLLPEILHRAIDGLREHDVVLGPATDGGYYLIGMKRFHPGLFRGIDWGSERVFEQTRSSAKRLGLRTLELVRQSDVDTSGDLRLLRNDPLFVDVFTRKPLISVVIPTFNEAQTLRRTLEAACRGEEVEIIVADGGSKDSTCEIASDCNAVVLQIPGGRASQLNSGAAEAKGRLLLFLHADTLLPERYEYMVRHALENPFTVAGAFRFQTDDSSISMRLIEWGANIRSHVFQWPYGDQGLFMERRIFEEAGGFSQLPIMEDFDLVMRLRRRGQVITLPQAAVTSARRWARLGVLRTTAINHAMIAGYLGGLPIRTLERFYRSSLAERRTVEKQNNKAEERTQS
jgi:rSAM/selenodomain-associated transferase 2/rSAM/selenodomain-associated transferase 1